MKNNLARKVTIAMLFCGISLLSFVFSAAAEPTVEEITLYPAEPWAQSTIIFNVTTAGEADESWLIVRECKNDSEGQMCFSDSFNESMTLIESNMFQAVITLKHDTATYIEYLVDMKSEGTWTKSDVTILNLSAPPVIDNDTDGDGNNNGNDGKSPGFELIVIFLAITTAVFIAKRKR